MPRDAAQLAGEPDLADRDQRSPATGRPRLALTSARATARSAAGARSDAPPTVAA